MDMETMRYKHKAYSYRIQIPTLLTFAYYDSTKQIKTFKTLIDTNLLEKEGSVRDLLIRLFREMKTLNIPKNTIFMHNLGKFDGFHLMTNFLDNLDIVKNLDTFSDLYKSM